MLRRSAFLRHGTLRLIQITVDDTKVGINAARQKTYSQFNVFSDADDASSGTGTRLHGIHGIKHFKVYNLQ